MRRKWGRIFSDFFIVLFIVLFVIALPELVVAELIICPAVTDFSETAQAQFPGKRIEALMAMVDCESCSLRDRNNAVWALGQLDDARALPVLEKYYTGAKSGYLSPDALRIALRHLRHQDLNRSESFLWRWTLPADN